MSATDELRRLLDERGVEHTDAEDGHTQHTWWSDGDHEIGASNSGERLAVYNLTPEQTIAATLGRPTFDDNLEQALSFMRIWISDDAHLGESELSAAFEKAEGLRKLDAIESAIAATVGRGECHNESNTESFFYCNECGCAHLRNPAYVDMPRYCPNCGRKVVDE